MVETGFVSEGRATNKWILGHPVNSDSPFSLLFVARTQCGPRDVGQEWLSLRKKWLRNVGIQSDRKHRLAPGAESADDEIFWWMTGHQSSLNQASNDLFSSFLGGLVSPATQRDTFAVDVGFERTE